MSLSVFIWKRMAAGHIIFADPNTNLLYTKTAIPSVQYKIRKGEQVLRTVVTADIK